MLSEDNVLELLFFLYHVGPEDWSQVARLIDRNLSYLKSYPHFYYLFLFYLKFFKIFFTGQAT